MHRPLVLLSVFIAALSSTCAFALGRAAPSGSDPYNAYRWNHSNGDWYEWWYYKAVIPETQEAVLFTYGIVNPWDTDGKNPASKAFLSFGHLDSGLFIENKFPVSAFDARSDSTSVRIGDNIATDRRIAGSLVDTSGRKVSWDISIEKDWTFDAMGWAMGVDWISNIFWYPAQAGATMNGSIEYAGRTITLDHAPAYQDRNWGRSFPKWWSWLVSNHFEGHPGTVLATGGGRPSLFGEISLFDAFSIGLRHEGHEYSFRITSGDRISADINFGKWEVQGENNLGERIVISAYAPKEKFVVLPFVTPQGNLFYDYEALLGDIHVQLFRGDEQLADLVTHEGGIEYGSPDHYSLKQLFGTQIHLR